MWRENCKFSQINNYNWSWKGKKNADNCMKKKKSSPWFRSYEHVKFWIISNSLKICKNTNIVFEPLLILKMKIRSLVCYHGSFHGFVLFLWNIPDGQQTSKEKAKQIHKLTSTEIMNIVFCFKTEKLSGVYGLICIHFERE